jgi:hypothetical protein
VGGVRIPVARSHLDLRRKFGPFECGDLGGGLVELLREGSLLGTNSLARPRLGLALRRRLRERRRLLVTLRVRVGEERLESCLLLEHA